MDPCVPPLLALLRTTLATRAQRPAAPAVREQHRLSARLPSGDAGSVEHAGIHESSRRTLVEGADCLWIPNLLPETQDHARQRALWAQSKWVAKSATIIDEPSGISLGSGLMRASQRHHQVVEVHKDPETAGCRTPVKLRMSPT